jgi:diguanylate cyclase (GGDEF)-like protein
MFRCHPWSGHADRESVGYVKYNLQSHCLVGSGENWMGGIIKENNNNAPPQRYTSQDLSTAFNDFLQITTAETRLLRSYHDALMVGAEEFAKVFYAYLMAFPATAQVLEDYRARGGKIEDLVHKQTQHLFGFLAGHSGEESVAHMERVGMLHYQHRIEPVWIMGAYLLYQNHLQTLLRTSARIKDADRATLEAVVLKLLFRDMGLMLEGYWTAARNALTTQSQKVAELQDQITGLLANIPQVLWSVDVVNNRPLYVSPVAYEVCDLEISLPIPCLNWTLPEDQELVRSAWQQALGGNQVEIETRVRRPNGELRWFRRVFYPYSDASGRVVRVDGLMEDTTHAKTMIQRLHTLATTDALTGLPNRTLLNDRLNQAIAAAARDGQKQVVLMLMDLNHFKEINDTLGHSAGDRVLALVAQRLNEVLRDTDTLARLGGDEFALVLPDVTHARSTAQRVANKVLRSFHAPFRVAENELFLGTSIGIAIYPEHGTDIDTLMSRADVAMYSTKNKDPGYLFYTPVLDPNAQRHLQLSADLRHALARDELMLYYQPKIDIRTGRVVGAEALIRWRHPQLGVLLPEMFMPLAERAGLIKPITDWVIHTAVKQCRHWHDTGHRLRVAVNVPGRAFQDPTLVSKVSSALLGLGAAPESLEIEITENVLMSDTELVSKVLRDLTELGITIAIDDFGTGYSSLTYLKQLPLHTLKIDKSFIMNMDNDENDAVIVRSTIDLAHNLGRQVVAEGIETKEAWDLLCVLGCDGAQGFHISRPLPSEEFGQWLKASPWSQAAPR